MSLRRTAVWFYFWGATLITFTGIYWHKIDSLNYADYDQYFLNPLEMETSICFWLNCFSSAKFILIDGGYLDNDQALREKVLVDHKNLIQNDNQVISSLGDFSEAKEVWLSYLTYPPEDSQREKNYYYW